MTAPATDPRLSCRVKANRISLSRTSFFLIKALPMPKSAKNAANEVIRMPMAKTPKTAGQNGLRSQRHHDAQPTSDITPKGCLYSAFEQRHWPFLVPDNEPAILSATRFSPRAGSWAEAGF
jgi:hypothetical protein